MTGRAVFVIYVAALVYASLNPFIGWQWPQAITLFVWPRYVTFFDVIVNVAAYAPFGALLAALLRRRALRLGLRHATRNALLIAIVASCGLSLSMEMAQAFLPARVSSPLDFLTNALGGVIGACAALSAPMQRLFHAVSEWRRQRFARLVETNWGLLLLAIWLFAQLNPAIPFFEAGCLVLVASAIGPSSAHPYDPTILLPQVVGIVFNVCAFALFVSILLHPAKRVLTNVASLMAIGFSLKVAMASLLLKTPQLASSLSPGAVLGIIAGFACFVFFVGIGYRWRAFWAALLVFAGGVMAKLSSVYAAFSETMRLFNWPYGHLATFANLTQWLHEIWPLAALIFLAAVFVRRPS